MAKGTQFKDYLWYLVIVIIASSVGLLFDHLGRPEFERPATFALAMMLLAVKVCRDVRGRPWFWIAIIAIAALHVPLLMLTAHRLSGAPFAEMFSLAILDGVVMIIIVRLVERVIGGKDPSVSAVCENPKSQS